MTNKKTFLLAGGSETGQKKFGEHNYVVSVLWRHPFVFPWQRRISHASDQLWFSSKYDGVRNRTVLELSQEFYNGTWPTRKWKHGIPQTSKRWADGSLPYHESRKMNWNYRTNSYQHLSIMMPIYVTSALYRMVSGYNTSSQSSPLSFFRSVSVALVLRCKYPPLGRRTEE